ncbi:MAG: HAMP domain-containing histidine kinase [Clostridia bacterium]|nr:HAMP domain-containing histidine kinase [Clostridia bacterium]
MKKRPLKHPSQGERATRRYRSLRVVLISYVFTLMLISGLITGTILFLLNALFGFIRIVQSAPFGLLLIMFIPSLIIGSALAALLSFRILYPLRETIRAAKKLGEGDLSVRVHDDKGIFEVAELQEAFNSMASDLEQTEIFRKDFISNFSHEFKTPIVSIRGFAHQLRYGDLPEERREEYLEIICKESDRLTRMASRILLLSQYENQTIVGGKTSYDLDEQLRHCILLLEKQWDEKNLELDLDLDTVRCYANEEMLAELWVNLLGNAVKFTPENGTVGVSLRQDGQNVTVRITDTGIGMPEEIRDRIFDKFYQGDSSHKSEGNGIGLTLVRRIVELCGGEITVESEEQKGSTFTVTLPIAETVAELETPQ